MNAVPPLVDELTLVLRWAFIARHLYAIEFPRS
jgi:hypothetical protein